MHGEEKVKKQTWKKCRIGKY